MKSSWQQAQDQMRQQQEALRRRQQMAAWTARQAGVSAPRDRFAQAEAEAARLRWDLASGPLSIARYAERLKALTIQDGLGTWWMIEAQTGRWYRYDGTRWLPGRPPGRDSVDLVRAGPRAAELPLERQRHRFWAVVVLMVGLPLAWFAGLAVDAMIGGSLWLAPVVVSVTVTAVIARRLWG